MTNTSRAAVFVGPGQPLEIRDFALPRLQTGEALVKVSCCTLCGSDLHTYAGRRASPCPGVLGHEMVGHIAELPKVGELRDSSGAPLQVGQRVVWSVAANCGDCFYCRNELPQKCSRLFKYGHQAVDELHPLSGGLADYCHLVPGTPIVSVPETIPDNAAGPLSCATATAAAALRTAGDCRDRVVLIFGAGLLGLTAAALAHSRAAKAVLVCDVDSQRLAVATRFGASHTFNISQTDEALTAAARELTDGRGVDAAIEMSGSAAAFEQGLKQLRIGGRFVLVGSVFPGPPANLPLEAVVRKLLRLEGVHNYIPADLNAAVEFLAANHLTYPFAEIVSKSFPLEQTSDAFEYALQSRALRVAVTP